MSEDLNLSVLCGRLATEPDVVVCDSGARRIQFLLTVHARHPNRRVDVVPVTLYDPPDWLVDDLPGQNSRIWVTGAFQRRSQDGPEGRRARIEVVADHVVVIDHAPARVRRLAR